MKTLNVKDDIYTVLNCSKCSNLGLEKCCIENMRCSMGIDTYMILKKPDHCQLAKIRSMTVKEIQFNHKGCPELYLVTKEHQIILRQLDFNNPGSKYPQSAWLEILYDGYLRSMGTLCQLYCDALLDGGACLYLVMCIIMTLKKGVTWITAFKLNTFLMTEFRNNLIQTLNEPERGPIVGQPQEIELEEIHFGLIPLVMMMA